MHEYMDTIGRTILSFGLLLLVARVLGKQTLSNMTFHDFVTGITLGAIAANLAFNEKIKMMELILSLAVFSGTSYLMSNIAIKIQKSRKWISGAPTVLIENGKILEENMRKNKYTMDSLNQSLRQKDIFNLQEVENAVVETNGKLSVQKKTEFQSVTKKDLQIFTGGKEKFPIELVMEGQILEDNLRQNKLSKDWLHKEIKRIGKDLDEIFYAVKTSNGTIVFDFYADYIKSPIDKE
ncbi:DUF421 domain-containing protein [Brevibacillus laterosporus]|uniref:Putative membrane protein n=1 Tax=Brevibacillus laterosporus LMG 15441 TaxID=1042163 RepID=A0A075R8P2_BRELA|nr:DUF421 domain-containing protein [Brevibacillus laterosporus]AIG25935.1 putative membrane protein [Brevibacillus laterosporus LMG 15441]AUM64557.1 DUF421 domain-containing protein [Brevibacillus laterosporus]AYK07451.1 DUF421 domain-containing protein [Brevibacillus laterosporus]RJL12955.1 DUF421 domain-containing protein [Brevibacillus laterosporus]TPH08134.1 DUF421 domain-containing protein [Brevibacillus laterosporus]